MGRLNESMTGVASMPVVQTTFSIYIERGKEVKRERDEYVGVVTGLFVISLSLRAVRVQSNNRRNGINVL